MLDINVLHFGKFFASKGTELVVRLKEFPVG
jgi:hypothetical protein